MSCPVLFIKEMKRVIKLKGQLLENRLTRTLISIRYLSHIILNHNTLMKVDIIIVIALCPELIEAF